MNIMMTSRAQSFSEECDVITVAIEVSISLKLEALMGPRADNNRCARDCVICPMYATPLSIIPDHVGICHPRLRRSWHLVQEISMRRDN